MAPPIPEELYPKGLTLQSLAPDGLAPILVGVTGHRDLHPDGVAALAAEVRRFFAAVRDRYPHSPLVLLSALAEGADRLVARVALDMGMPLLVALPMQQADYEGQFAGAQSVGAFRALLDEARGVYTVPLLAGVTAESLRESAEHRALQYAALGAHIARTCHVLLALWDGCPGRGEGGTAQVVGFRLHGAPPPYGPARGYLEPADTGSVFHITARRGSGGETVGPPGAARRLHPPQADEERPLGERILRLIDTYNCDASELQRSQPRSAEGALLPDTLLKALPAQLQADQAMYQTANGLALRYQALSRRTLLGLYALPIAAVLGLILYGNIRPVPWLLLLYPLFLGLAALLLWWVSCRRLRDKHTEYRALAELQRVRFFWRLAGVDGDPVEHFLSQHRSELDWIRWVGRGLPLPVPAAPDDEGCRQAMAHWVRHQGSYYAESADRDAARLRPADLWATLTYGTGAGIALVMLLLNHWLQGEQHLLHQALLSLVGLAPVVVAAIEGYAERMGYSQQLRSYRKMAVVFARAASQLDQVLSVGGVKGARTILRELGAAALAESTGWVLMRRERPLAFQKV